MLGKDERAEVTATLHHHDIRHIDDFMLEQDELYVYHVYSARYSGPLSPYKNIECYNKAIMYNR